MDLNSKQLFIVVDKENTEIESPAYIHRDIMGDNTKFELVYVQDEKGDILKNAKYILYPQRGVVLTQDELLQVCINTIRNLAKQSEDYKRKDFEYRVHEALYAKVEEDESTPSLENIRIPEPVQIIANQTGNDIVVRTPYPVRQEISIPKTSRKGWTTTYDAHYCGQYGTQIEPEQSALPYEMPVEGYDALDQSRFPQEGGLRDGTIWHYIDIHSNIANIAQLQNGTWVRIR